MKHSKKSSSKIMNDIQYIFKNVYVLYTLVILAVVYLFMLLTMNNFNAIGFFILLGIIVYCYTKNMSIILSTCILFTLIIFPMSNKEGLANPSPETPPAKNKVTTPPSTAPPTTVSSTVSPPAPSSTVSSTVSSDPPSVDPNVPAPNVPEESFTGKLANASYVDPAATMTQAFTNLENMLGGDGINKLSHDTQNLVANQAQLFKTIENMTPLIDKATGLMEKFSKF
jgi:hypothetical protein